MTDIQTEPALRPPKMSAAAIARACGVSPATVSYVMNGKPGVSTETRRHIIKVANELGFRPNRNTGQDGIHLDPRLNRVIGLILPNIVNPMYTGWAENIITATGRDGFEVFVATTQDNPDTLAQVAATFAARNVDGIIIAAALREDSRALRTLRQRRVPYICLSRRSDHLPGDFVGIDDDAAATQLMQHVLDHGYREIATVSGPRFSTASLAREQAFVRTAAAAGVTITGERKISTRLNRDGGRVAAEKLLASANPPRAIVCGADEIAIGIMEHALSMGLRIPEDLAVVGSDGLPHSRSELVGLTTIVQPVQEMANNAFSLLLGQITHPRNTFTHILCEHRLHLGRTCGCPPGATRNN
ncbi:LacI family DNA-binding transcriptional regulator [Arthrobacter sp. VKM Ac-2550]|uniref:LacI family DNA-binding transcriptional regulator n=1 Tax=Crystallibacter permensis TaxID=1938888 RepID=UPI0022275E85|nr:LacI family DNA-binding transcriptional regulator [Arthrobacter sp. VKM Ac-2550]MCW2133064.1 transcriptional regulator, LacI family [Arthrobacter sp. VKM Ac-2550]